ncbi:DUF1345 domain-containing protein [Rhodoferax sp.]|uniref:DUF1345 domain-containing protein n=1 Tax=Rhodoferax sp. TaxID=50421 RepID=UPI0028528C48|nr:DUF1345 domain-containing protein [Rhodoferax sp.]
MKQASNPQVTPAPYALRVLLSRPAFWGSLLLGVVVAWIVPAQAAQPWLPKVIIGWNLGAGVFLVFSAWHIFSKPRTSVQALATKQQAGKWLVLGMAVVAGLLCLGVTMAELSVAREFQGPARMAHTILAGMTLVTTWAVTQVVFALHYAQAYFYEHEQATHDYRDFLALSIGLGTLGRSGRDSLISPELQWVGKLQRVMAVAFIVTLLVMAANIVSVLP